jgi:ABC-2 type transport system ATP-binding protein
MSVIAKNITKFYGAQKALDEVSFDIKSGKIVGFLGPNGAGKSTMMKIITGYLTPTSGRVTVNNFDLMEHPLKVKEQIGYLPENNPLYYEMYVREYLKFVAGIYKLGNQTKQRVEEIIQQTGLEPEHRKKIGALSKGYRQRVGLAQALIHNPKVLILDEPTAGLDPNQTIEIRNLISRAGKEKTVLLSTHIMQEVEAICDRIIIINNGRILADDAKGDIYTYVEEKHQTIHVEFSRPVEKKKLELIEGVNKVKNLKNNQWLIQSDPEKDIRSDIFNFAVQHNLTVLSMQKQEKSLEQVFQQLTK